MQISKELMAHILKGAEKCSDQAGFITTTIDGYAKIHTTRMQCHKRRDQAKDHYQNCLKTIAADEQTNQEQCDHPVRSFHPDASGNNDSSSSCDICGLERKRFATPSYDG